MLLKMVRCFETWLNMPKTGLVMVNICCINWQNIFSKLFAKIYDQPYIVSLLLIVPDCPPLSPNKGRCGPSWGGRCNHNLADYAIYCNEDNGWCGSTSDHEHAQSSDMYDWEPKSCKSKNWLISYVFVDYKRKKFIWQFKNKSN